MDRRREAVQDKIDKVRSRVRPSTEMFLGTMGAAGMLVLPNPNQIVRNTEFAISLSLMAIAYHGLLRYSRSVRLRLAEQDCIKNTEQISDRDAQIETRTGEAEEAESSLAT
jgi:hypothetical protein